MVQTILTTCCFVLLCSTSFAQFDIPAAPTLGQDAAPVAGPFEPEELTRGPVHEAFAEQINADPSLGILVAQAPPATIDEIPPEYKPEGDNISWIPGYWWWDEDAGEYLWVSGVWRAVPPDQQWVAGYWAQADAGVQWVSGFFTSQKPDQLVYQEAPPVSLDRGPTGPAPSDEHFWYPGFWDKNYKWNAGYWHPLREDRVWIPARWVATPHGCCFVAGHWDYQLAKRGQLFAPVRFRGRRPAKYVYRPNCVIQPSVLELHLFVRPRWRTYCFGDWYDESASRRMYSYANYHTGRHGYCPLFAYSRARYARRGINLTVRLGDWNRYFTKNRGFRPRRTFANQRVFDRQHINKPYASYVRIGVNLLDLAVRASSGRGGSAGVRLVKITDQQIRRERERSQIIRTVARERAKREAVAFRGGSPGRGFGGSSRPGGSPRVDIFRDRSPRSVASRPQGLPSKRPPSSGGDRNRSNAGLPPSSRGGSDRFRSSNSPSSRGRPGDSGSRSSRSGGVPPSNRGGGGGGSKSFRPGGSSKGPGGSSRGSGGGRGPGKKK